MGAVTGAVPPLHQKEPFEMLEPEGPMRGLAVATTGAVIEPGSMGARQIIVGLVAIISRSHGKTSTGCVAAKMSPNARRTAKRIGRDAREVSRREIINVWA